MGPALNALSLPRALALALVLALALSLALAALAPSPCPVPFPAQVFTVLFQYVEELGRLRGDVRKLRLYVERTNTAAQRTYAQLGMEHSHYDMYEKDMMVPR